MPVISGGNIIQGGVGRVLENAGAPAGGTDAVYTLTFAGTITGGTFKLRYDGYTTAAITWSSTNSTLLANIQAALDALPNLGDDDVVAADVDLSSGVGDATLTFSGAGVAKLAVSAPTVADDSLTGSGAEVTIAETTPGVTATHRDAAKGAVLSDTTNGELFINSGVAGAPTWTLVGGQT